MKKIEITKEQYHLNKKYFIRNSEIFHTTMFDEKGVFLDYKYEALLALSVVLINNKNEKIAAFVNDIDKNEKYIFFDNGIKGKIISTKKTRRLYKNVKTNINLVKYEEFK